MTEEEIAEALQQAKAATDVLVDALCEYDGPPLIAAIAMFRLFRAYVLEERDVELAATSLQWVIDLLAEIAPDRLSVVVRRADAGPSIH